MKEYGTKIMSWGPFAEGRNDFFTNPTLQEIGKEYGKSVAQVALRYLIQRDIIVIPKSTHKERMMENFNVFIGIYYLPLFTIINQPLHHLRIIVGEKECFSCIKRSDGRHVIRC